MKETQYRGSREECEKNERDNTAYESKDPSMPMAESWNRDFGPTTGRNRTQLKLSSKALSVFGVSRKKPNPASTLTSVLMHCYPRYPGF